MKIGIIDADLIDERKIKGKRKHRFPNLASMKISAYYKERGNDVSLVTSYDDVKNYEKVFISKVFTDTFVPNEVLALPNVEYGGTGFFYDKAEPLQYDIEHHMPDYHLYDDWVNQKLNEGIDNDCDEEDRKKTIQNRRKDFVYYLDYSIGFLTRGCIRGCSFCVNKNYKQCSKHSPVTEFIGEDRRYLCFLDDNFLACPDWKSIIEEVKATKKRFQFKQGLDERLLTDEKIVEIFNWNYIGDYIFAFDNIQDKDIIERKLKRIHELFPDMNKQLKFYVLVGYDRNNKYDEEFWKQDIRDAFERVGILTKYSAYPYIMRYEKCYTAPEPYRGVYVYLTMWCNQQNTFVKSSYEVASKCVSMGNKYYAKYKRNIELYEKEIGKKNAGWRYYDELCAVLPELKERYLTKTPQEIAEYGKWVRYDN